MAENEEHLQTVYACPVLYGLSLFDYHGSERRARAWREVAASIGLSVVECKLEKEESLALLDVHIRQRKRRRDEEDPEQPLAPSATAASLNGRAEEKEPLKSCEKAERAFDEDELFLLSYVPALKRLTPQKRAAVKMQIQQIMFDAEFKEQ